jgi:hypothetical protein
MCWGVLSEPTGLRALRLVIKQATHPAECARLAATNTGLSKSPFGAENVSILTLETSSSTCSNSSSTRVTKKLNLES